MIHYDFIGKFTHTVFPLPIKEYIAFNIATISSENIFEKDITAFVINFVPLRQLDTNTNQKVFYIDKTHPQCTIRVSQQDIIEWFDVKYQQGTTIIAE